MCFSTGHLHPRRGGVSDVSDPLTYRVEPDMSDDFGGLSPIFKLLILDILILTLRAETDSTRYQQREKYKKPSRCDFLVSSHVSIALVIWREVIQSVAITERERKQRGHPSSRSGKHIALYFVRSRLSSI